MLEFAPHSLRDTEPLDAMLQALGGDNAHFWREVVDTMNEGLLLISPDKRVVYINRKAQEIIGRSLEEARGMPCIDAIRCPQCNCCCRLFDEGEMEGVSVSIYNEHEDKPRVLLKNARLLHDDQGRIIGGIETFKDITEQYEQSAEKERFTTLLSEEKCRTEALLGSLREGVFSLNAEMRITSFSLRMVELTGIPAERALGQALDTIFAPRKPLFDVGKSEELDGRSCRVSLNEKLGKDLHAELFFRRVQGSSDEILGTLRPLQQETDQQNPDRHSFMGIVSRSPKMQQIFALLENAGDSEANILIEGESGTGKELVARAIHNISARQSEPFYAVNCATFTGSLLLSELFGHERGSFTGAYKTSKGKLELAGTGTLFLDEISEIPLQYQGLLLRVLEDRQFERVGGQYKITMGARIISATNEKLEEAVRQGRFRQDLYYRLRVVPVRVPPLRERREDLPLLAAYFAKHPGINLSGDTVRFSAEAMRAMQAYRWPGNVRELRNLIEYLCFVAKGEIDLEDLPPEIRERAHPVEPIDVYETSPLPEQAPLAVPPASALSAQGSAAGPAIERAQAPQDPEAQALLTALEQAKFNKGRAAEILGINRSTLWRRMKKHGIQSS